ncbi:unnamed protein product [Calypogeia fissa]
MGAQPAHFENYVDPNDGEDELDEEDEHHVTEVSPNVDPLDVDTFNSTMESDDVERALGRVDVLIDQIIDQALKTPLNAAMQTPTHFKQPNEGIPMIVNHTEINWSMRSILTKALPKVKKLENRQTKPLMW